MIFKSVIIANTESKTNVDTGDRDIIVAKGIIIIGKIDLVGVQTQQLAQMQNMKFTYSVEIGRKFYNNEKYCYFDETLYQIEAITKSKDENKMLLNVLVLKNNEVKEAIEEWKATRKSQS